MCQSKVSCPLIVTLIACVIASCVEVASHSIGEYNQQHHFHTAAYPCVHKCVCDCVFSLLPPSQSPTAPYPVRAAVEGAVRASACGRGGGGVCVRGGCPASPPAVGTRRWARRGGCEGLDSLPSEAGVKTED